MPRAARRFAWAYLFAAVVSTPAALAETETAGFRPVDVVAKPIETFLIGSDQTTFGPLQFRGGLDLSSPDPAFGSLSGLDFSPDGTTLYGVSDTGFWFVARPLMADGRLTGLEDPRVAPILDTAGQPITTKRQGDAESLRVVEKDGRLVAFVTIEQARELLQFTADPDFATARARALKLPSMSGVRRNQGLEALAVAPAGSRLAGASVLITERSLDKAGNHRAWILGGKRPGAFAVRRSDDYDVTDAAFLPGGDLLVLERRFSLTAGGLAMRLRRIPGGDLRPGATVDGPVLVEADMRSQVDNMEGLAVRPGEDGETLIAIVSDNNHNLLQRTLLLFFALPASATEVDVPLPPMRPRS